MTDEELRKESTYTVQWECTPILDRPTFVNGYITGSKPREERIVSLEKENAELKEQLGDKVMQKRKDKADLVWKLKTANEQKAVQLTKAKEILRKFLDAKSIEETCVAESEADKFLSEVENA